MLYSSLIVFYLGLHYANEKMFNESLMILKRGQSQIEKVNEFVARNGLKG